jgi:OOP family OmpA-OmpF porin
VKIFKQIVIVTMAVVFLGACGFSGDTIRYSMGNWDGVKYHEVETNECCTEEVVVPEPIKQSQIVNVYFDYDDSMLRFDQVPQVVRIQNFLNENPEATVELSGYASEEGDVDYNIALSERRVMTVKTELMARGVDESRISTAVGKGETSIFGAGEDLYPKNRVVVVFSK